jgi:opacity protein-like surface antigen
MRRSLVWMAGVLMIAGMPARAAADVLLTPFAGVAFADDTDENKFNYGASIGVGSLIGFEADFSQTRLGHVDFGTSNLDLVDLNFKATTIMGNLVVRWPVGPVQPYASGGAGVIRLSADIDVAFLGNVVSASAQDVAMNVGGGLYLFPSRNLGIRGDVRYFRTLTDLSLDDLTDISGLDDLPLPRIDFWRVTGGITFKF